MLTMGVAVAPVVEWCAEDLMVLSYQVRFTKPVVVDPQLGASLHVEVAVGAINTIDDLPTTVRCDLTVTSNTGDKVLGKAQAIIRPV
jgi:acyl dehydratase